MGETYETGYSFTLSDETGDLWETHLGGESVSPDDYDNGNWGWPGAEALREVFGQMAEAMKNKPIGEDADLTLTPAIKAAGDWEDEDPMTWRIFRDERGRIAWENIDITHIEAYDWPQRGAVTWQPSGRPQEIRELGRLKEKT